MAMHSLLARLRAPHLALIREGAVADTLRRSAIVDHIRSMCLTRLGTVPAHPDYGLPDVSEMVHDFPDAIESLRRALLHTITRYEPRVSNVHVRHLPGGTLDLVVRFEVTASLAAEGRTTPVRFETVLAPSHAPDVR